MFEEARNIDVLKGINQIAALNRKGWKKLLKEAEAHPGL
jgi:hypothetical protein